MVPPEVRDWELVESYGLQTLCECHERRCGCSADIGTGENRGPEEDVSWCGRRRACSGWQEGLGERTRKTPKEAQWPEENGKAYRGQTKLDQQRIQKSQSESAKLAEWQESLRVRKETLRVAYEEIKILREDLLREGKSMDKHKSHFMSPEKNSNPRATRIDCLGSAEEIAGWMMEAQRLNKEVEEKKRKLQETIEKNSGKDARMGDDSMDGLDGSLSSRGCEHGYCKQYPSGNGLLPGKNSGLSSAVTEPVSLKVLSWNVAGRRIPLTTSCRKSRCSQIGTC